MQKAKTPNANLIKSSKSTSVVEKSSTEHHQQNQQCSILFSEQSNEETEQSKCKLKIKEIYKDVNKGREIVNNKNGLATGQEANLLINEKEELNNNQLERKNANNNYEINNDSVNKWLSNKSDQQIYQQPASPTANQASTPIYLHYPPSLSNSDLSFMIDKNQLLKSTACSTSQFQHTSIMNDNHLASSTLLTNQLDQQSREDQLHLNQLNEAEQRMEQRLKRSRLTSRLSNDSTSTESTKEERLNKDLPYPEYVRYSFNWLPQDSEWRSFCLKIITNPWFERISMTAILINCITLGMYHPCADEICLRPKCRLLQMFDDIIFAFFALEMLVKMTAMGVRGTKGAYFSETWNRLDFFIVVSG